MRTSIDGLGDAIMSQLEEWNENTVKRAANETFEELAAMADVYYGSGRLSDEQYTEIVNLIGQRE